MRVSEAKYIREILGKIESNLLSPCIDLGSSTSHFRKIIKPHIEQQIMAPLESRGVQVIHSDLKVGEGVDLPGDIFESTTQSEIKLIQPKLILCCNMLEHVQNLKEIVNILSSLLPVNGFLLVSVPHSYPIHMDPIDTYFRPTPEEVSQLFTEFICVESSIVASSSYLQDILSGANSLVHLKKLAKKLITCFNPFYGRKEWKRRHHRLFWLFRQYRITVILLKKKEKVL